jgi:single-stranded DNA-binding protein
MLNVLATGTLVSDPKSRLSTNGKSYATASLRVPAEDAEAMLISVIAFNVDAVVAILALTKGDSCAIAGRGKLTSWTKDGEEKHGLSVTADKVLTVYQAGKVRKAAREAEAMLATS